MGQKAWGDPAVAAAMKAKIPLGKFCGMFLLIHTCESLFLYEGCVRDM